MIYRIKKKTAQKTILVLDSGSAAPLPRECGRSASVASERREDSDVGLFCCEFISHIIYIFIYISISISGSGYMVVLCACVCVCVRMCVYLCLFYCFFFLCGTAHNGGSV